MKAILSLLVENKPGILFQVTHLFRSRNFNIDSISVGVTENPEFSRITIITHGDKKQVRQILKQLDKMIDTIEVYELDEAKTMYRELILFKIKVNSAESAQKIRIIADDYNAVAYNSNSFSFTQTTQSDQSQQQTSNNNSIIIQLVDTPDKINAFAKLLEPFGIIDTSRTGVAALQQDDYHNNNNEGNTNNGEEDK